MSLPEFTEYRLQILPTGISLPHNYVCPSVCLAADALHVASGRDADSTVQHCCVSTEQEELVSMEQADGHSLFDPRAHMHSVDIADFGRHLICVGPSANTPRSTGTGSGQAGMYYKVLLTSSGRAPDFRSIRKDCSWQLGTTPAKSNLVPCRYGYSTCPLPDPKSGLVTRVLLFGGYARQGKEGVRYYNDLHYLTFTRGSGSEGQGGGVLSVGRWATMFEGSSGGDTAPPASAPVPMAGGKAAPGPPPFPSPCPRAYAAICYHESRVILHGGLDGRGRVLSDMWAFTAPQVGWAQVQLSTVPTAVQAPLPLQPRCGHAIMRAKNGQGVFIFGGSSQGAVFTTPLASRGQGEEPAHSTQAAQPPPAPCTTVQHVSLPRLRSADGGLHKGMVQTMEMVQGEEGAAAAASASFCVLTHALAQGSGHVRLWRALMAACSTLVGRALPGEEVERRVRAHADIVLLVAGSSSAVQQGHGAGKGRNKGKEKGKGEGSTGLHILLLLSSPYALLPAPSPHPTPVPRAGGAGGSVLLSSSAAIATQVAQSARRPPRHREAEESEEGSAGKDGAGPGPGAAHASGKKKGKGASNAAASAAAQRGLLAPPLLLPTQPGPVLPVLPAGKRGTGVGVGVRGGVAGSKAGVADLYKSQHTDSTSQQAASASAGASAGGGESTVPPPSQVLGGGDASASASQGEEGEDDRDVRRQASTGARVGGAGSVAAPGPTQGKDMDWFNTATIPEGGSALVGAGGEYVPEAMIAEGGNALVGAGGEYVPEATQQTTALAHALLAAAAGDTDSSGLAGKGRAGAPPPHEEEGEGAGVQATQAVRPTAHHPSESDGEAEETEDEAEAEVHLPPVSPTQVAQPHMEDVWEQVRGEGVGPAAPAASPVPPAVIGAGGKSGRLRKAATPAAPSLPTQAPAPAAHAGVKRKRPVVADDEEEEEEGEHREGGRAGKAGQAAQLNDSLPLLRMPRVKPLAPLLASPSALAPAAPAAPPLQQAGKGTSSKRGAGAGGGEEGKAAVALQSALRKAEGEIQRLKEEKAELQAQMAAAAKRAAAAPTPAKPALASAAAAAAAVASVKYQAELAKAHGRIQVLEGALSKAQREGEEVRARLKKVEGEVSSARAAAETGIAMKAVQAQLKAEQARRASAEAALEAARATHAHELGQVQGRVEAAGLKLKSVEAECKLHKQAAVSAEQALAKVQAAHGKELAGKDSTIGQLQARLAASEASLSSLRAHLLAIGSAATQDVQGVIKGMDAAGKGGTGKGEVARAGARGRQVGGHQGHAEDAEDEADEEDDSEEEEEEQEQEEEGKGTGRKRGRHSTSQGRAGGKPSRHRAAATPDPARSGKRKR